MTEQMLFEIGQRYGKRIEEYKILVFINIKKTYLRNKIMFKSIRIQK